MLNQFDNLCKIAALICQASRAIIVLKDGNELRLTASFGTIKEYYPQRQYSFSGATMKSTSFIEVSDTWMDDRYKNDINVVEEPFVRFYAGTQIFDEESQIIGVLSVSDEAPKVLRDEQKEALRTIAKEVVTHLSLKKREAELQVQRSHLDDLVSMAAISPEISTIFDYNGSILYVNPAVDKLLNYTPEQLLNMSIWDICYPPDVDFVRNALEKRLQNQETEFKIDFKMLSTLGNIKLFSWTMVSRNGRWYAYGRDITETKRVKNELTNLSFVASKVNNAIVINDANNHVTWVNEAFQNITGFTLADLKGKRLGDLITGPKTDVGLIEEAREKNRKNESFTVDLLAYRKDKKPIWLSIHNTLIFDDEGEASAEVEIIIDITDKKLAEQEMLEAKEQALKLSETKEMFVSVMSHEIRTPLNAILGITHLLMESPLSPAQRDDLNILKFSGENLLHIVNDVLDFTKMETGNLVLESMPFSLEMLVKDIANSLQVNVAKRGNTLNLIYDDSIPDRIMGDKTRLYQILMNLLGNANKFTDRGLIELDIKAEVERDDAIVLSFKVKDNGIGIPADKLDYIFESFTQAKSSISSKYGGTGLGLAITKKLVKLHGSDIQVESKEGVGAVFSFVIAFDKIPVVKTISPFEEVIPESFKGKRLLVVDDNEINVLIAKRMLSKWGLNTDIAYGGLEALEKVKNGYYDLVFMDVKMPDLDGFEATMAIRKLEGDYYKNLPIVALTASSLNDELARYRDSGLNGHLMKPINPEAFKKIIMEFLSENE